MKPHIESALFVILTVCCGMTLAAEPLSEIKYTCDIPENLKKDIVLYHKDGSTEIRDGHAIYKRYHSKGWHGMIGHYAKTGNTTFDPLSRQEWGIMTIARSIGISEARTLIHKAELVFGKKKLRAALENKASESKERSQ